MIISGLYAYSGGGFLILMGFVSMIVGSILTRVYCELLIIFFKMQESLVHIRNLLERQKNNVQNEHV